MARKAPKLLKVPQFFDILILKKFRKGPKSMNHPVTILQIAEESGVSTATVSRVINGTAPVSQATRERVNAVIERHAYTPNAFARGLISRRSMTIGIIMPDISNPYFSAMFQEIEEAAQAAHYSVFLCNTSFRASTARETELRELDSFQMMLDKNVDGVLVAGGQADLLCVSEAYRAALRRLSSLVPVVVLGSPIDGVDCLFIQRERGEGVSAAVRCLASLGHRRIAFLGGEAGVGITEARLTAYKAALAGLGLPQDDALIALSDYYTPDGCRAMSNLLSRKTPFTALLAMNDSVAFGAYRALADAGLRVPDDVSVISCDQFFSADYFVPRLTSVDQHNERFGRLIINALLGVMNGEQAEVSFTYGPELVVRESCAPVPAEQ